jgi:hypothetical protein
LDIFGTSDFAPCMKEYEENILFQSATLPAYVTEGKHRITESTKSDILRNCVLTRVTKAQYHYVHPRTGHEETEEE